MIFIREKISPVPFFLIYFCHILAIYTDYHNAACGRNQKFLATKLHRNTWHVNFQLKAGSVAEPFDSFLVLSQNRLIQ